MRARSGPPIAGRARSAATNEAKVPAPAKRRDGVSVRARSRVSNVRNEQHGRTSSGQRVSTSLSRRWENVR